MKGVSSEEIVVGDSIKDLEGFAGVCEREGMERERGVRVLEGLWCCEFGVCLEVIRGVIESGEWLGVKVMEIEGLVCEFGKWLGVMGEGFGVWREETHLCVESCVVVLVLVDNC